MNKITYERHYFAGIIPFFIVLVLGFTSLTNFSLIVIFACSTFLPFLFFFTFLKNTGTSRNQILKIISGAIFIVLGFLLGPEIINELVRNLNTSPDYMNIIAPILMIMGILLIFDSFRKEILSYKL